MSVEGIESGEEKGISLFSGEKSYRDGVCEAISSFASRVIQLNCFCKRGVLQTFTPIHVGEYGQANSLVLEVAYRAMRFAIATPTWMGTLLFSTCASMMAAVANGIHSRSYRVTCGTFDGELSKKPKLFLLNPRMLSGLNPLKKGGVALGGERFDRLVSTIRDNNPDIVFLPEIDRWNASSLTGLLKDQYQFFFTGMGEKALGEDASFFIAFRGELVKPPEYISFKKQGGFMERGYFIMETVDRVYVSTYLPKREDWDEIFSRDFGGKKVTLMGEMDLELEEYLREKGFVSSLLEGVELTTSAPYNHFHGKEREGIKEGPFLFLSQVGGETEMIPMHDIEKIDEALSDHPLILHRLAK